MKIIELVYETLHSVIGYHGAVVTSQKLSPAALREAMTRMDYVMITGLRAQESLGRPAAQIVFVLINEGVKTNGAAPFFKKIVKSIPKENSKEGIALSLSFVSSNDFARLARRGAEDDGRMLSYDIFIADATKHVLAAKHRIMPKAELDAFCDRYYKIPSDLPTILRSDPIAIYYDLSPGMAVEVTFSSDTASEAVMYRLCR